MQLEWPGQPRLLTDWEIRHACKTHSLVTRDGKALEDELDGQVRYCSYELTVSERVDLLEVDSKGTTFHNHRVKDGHFWIPAKSTVKVFCREVINLPTFVFAQCIGLGQLFASGILVGSTYVDPGSKGTIYLSCSNVNDYDIRVDVGTPLARAFFNVLGSDVSFPHPGAGSRRRILYETREADHSRHSDSRPVAPKAGLNQNRLGRVMNVVAAITAVLVAIGTGSVAALTSWALHSKGFGWPIWVLAGALLLWLNLWFSGLFWSWLKTQELPKSFRKVLTFSSRVLIVVVVPVVIYMLQSSII